MNLNTQFLVAFCVKPVVKMNPHQLPAVTWIAYSNVVFILNCEGIRNSSLTFIMLLKLYCFCPASLQPSFNCNSLLFSVLLRLHKVRFSCVSPDVKSNFRTEWMTPSIYVSELWDSCEWNFVGHKNLVKTVFVWIFVQLYL